MYCCYMLDILPQSNEDLVLWINCGHVYYSNIFLFDSGGKGVVMGLKIAEIYFYLIQGKGGGELFCHGIVYCNNIFLSDSQEKGVSWDCILQQYISI